MQMNWKRFALGTVIGALISLLVYTNATSQAFALVTLLCANATLIALGVCYGVPASDGTRVDLVDMVAGVRFNPALAGSIIGALFWSAGLLWLSYAGHA